MLNFKPGLGKNYYFLFSYLFLNVLVKGNTHIHLCGGNKINLRSTWCRKEERGRKVFVFVLYNLQNALITQNAKVNSEFNLELLIILPQVA